MKYEIEIKQLLADEIEEFFIYLKDHIADNGKANTPLFLPISRNESGMPKGMKDSFKNGLSNSMDRVGWRRILIAKNKGKEIVGHIDLRSYDQNYSHHRAVLGMGVHRDYRKMGVGSLLVESIITWAKNETALERIDLQVLSNNKQAVRLYKKLQFKDIGMVEDMFRIDGESLNYIMMTKKIK